MQIQHILLLAKNDEELESLSFIYRHVKQLKTTSQQATFEQVTSGEYHSDSADIIWMLSDGHRVLDWVAQIRKCCIWQPIILITDVSITDADHERLQITDVLPRHQLIHQLQAAQSCRILESVMLKLAYDELQAIQLAQNFLTKIANEMLLADQAAQEIMHIVGSLAPADALNIAFFEGRFMVPRYLRGYSQRLDDVIRTTRLPLSYDNLVVLINTQQPHYINDTHNQFDWEVLDTNEHVRAWLGVPIIKNNQVIGVVNLDSHKPNVYHRQHINRLKEVMQHISVVVEMLQLYETLDEYGNVLAAITRQNAFLFASLNELQTIEDLCFRIAETVVNVFQVQDCGVMLVDKENTELIRYARSGELRVETDAPLFLDGSGLAVEAFHRQDVVYAPDVRKNPSYIPNEPRTRSELVVPLRTQSGTLGVLDLQSDRLNPFSRQDIEGLQAFANHAAVVIENLRYTNEQRELSKLLEEMVDQRTLELAQSYDRTQTILENTTEPIILINEDGHIEQVNAALARLTGRPEASFIDEPLEEFVFLRHREYLRKAIADAVFEGKGQRIELLIERAADSATPLATVEMSIVPVLIHHQDRGMSLVCTLEDVTRHRQIQQNLQKSLESERELSELRSKFIQIVSHEFRTPLAVILSSSEILRYYKDQLPDDRKEGHFEKIAGQVRHIETLLDDVLFMSRIETHETGLQPAPVDMQRLIEKTAGMVKTDYPQHTFILNAHGDDFMALGDEQLLVTMFTHLLNNAAKYSPNADTVQLTLDSQPDAVIVKIQDHGIGIPQADIAKLTQPFFRASNSGTVSGSGLGLAIVHYIVQRHQAEFHVDSVLDEGTTVTIRLKHA